MTLLSLREVKEFVDASKLYGSSVEYEHEYTRYGSYSFVHVSGVRLVVLVGERTILTQMVLGSVVSPAVLWRWNGEKLFWEIEDYDFLEGSVRLRTISDFIHFYGLNNKGA